MNTCHDRIRWKGTDLCKNDPKCGLDSTMNDATGMAHLSRPPARGHRHSVDAEQLLVQVADLRVIRHELGLGIKTK